MLINKEMWVAWKNDPVTKEVWNVINQLRENYKEGLAKDNFKDSEVAKAIGACHAYLSILVLEPEIRGDEDDAEASRE